MPTLASEADVVTREIQDRLAEEDRFRRFVKISGDAQDDMSFGGGRGELGFRRAEEALRLYGVLDADDWTSGLDRPSLTEDRSARSGRPPTSPWSPSPTAGCAAVPA